MKDFGSFTVIKINPHNINYKTTNKNYCMVVLQSSNTILSILAQYL